MKKQQWVAGVVCVVMVVLAAPPAVARDTRYMYTYEMMMGLPDSQERLSGAVKFYFGKQAHPAVEREIGTFVSNKKTNATVKTDERACQWAFLSAMRSLQQRAVREGGDAVINIHSYYKKNAMEGSDEFECGAGAFVAGVALRGTVVKLK